MTRPPSRSAGLGPLDLGRLGEAAAADLLISAGWRVLARNYRFARREVDLIVSRGGVVAFVEVKTRAGYGFGAPAEAVTRRKQREIELVAAEFLARRGREGVEVRFDVVAVLVDPRGALRHVEHLEDAWRPESAR